MSRTSDEIEASDRGEWDLFLSHRDVSADAKLALALASRLESERHPDGRPFRIWLAKLDIPPGRSVVGTINNGLERSRHVGLLLTPDYFNSTSGWTDAEWYAALSRDPSGRWGRVVPILLRNCPYIPALLRHLNMIDLRGTAHEREYERLVDLIRGVSAREGLSNGRVTRSDGRVSADTLWAERSPVMAGADVIEERLLANLLPIIGLPRRVWEAPLDDRLRSRGVARVGSFPDRGELKDIIRRDREKRGLKPFSPVFLRHGDSVVSLHRLDRRDGPLAPLVETHRAAKTASSKWAEDPDKRRLFTNLLNISLQRHLFRLGLTYDREKNRYFFPAGDGGNECRIRWRKRGRPRTVAKQLVDSDGRLYRWRHTAARLRVSAVGGDWFVHVRPTIVFTRDGSLGSILRGAVVGPMATKWLGRERNLHLAYHTYFWAHVLGEGHSPIRVRAAEQRIVIDPEPLQVRVGRGLSWDRVDLHAELEEAEDPDADLDLQEDEWVSQHKQAEGDEHED